MARKLGRIFGFIGSGASMIPGLWLIGQCISTLLQPDDAVHFESKGYASAFLIFGAIYCLIPTVGLVGSFLVRKNAMLAGAMMILPAVLMIPLLFSYGWYLVLAPLLLAAAGVLTMVGASNKAAP